MSVRPNFIPRTLIGVGGVRLFDIPGVHYPEEMLKKNPGDKKNDGTACKTKPAWGITTKEAAGMLGCTKSAARLSLHKKKVTKSIVNADGSRRLYWRKTEVEKLANALAPLTKKVDSSLVCSAEACKLLGVSRSTLQRYVRHGKLAVTNVRYVIPEGKGARLKSYFDRSAVEAVARRLDMEREWERRKREALAQLE